MLGRFSPDEVLAYQTLKIVKIKDYRLGGIYYLFLFLIVCWVVGYQILYSNDHFEKLDVAGTARVTIQQPTVRGCNPQYSSCKSDFRNLTELPYCEEFSGNASAAQGVLQRKCLYADKHTLNPHGLAEEGMFVPTRIDTIVQTRGCIPSAENYYSCSNEWDIKGHSGVVYVADIERSTLMLSHSYGRKEIQGTSPNIQGSFLECKSASGAKGDPRVELPLGAERSCDRGYISRNIRCITDKCPFLPKDPDVKQVFLQFERERYASRAAARHRGTELGGSLAPDVAELGGGGKGDSGDADSYEAALVQGGIFAIPDGDVISMAKLLEIAGVDLDKSFDAEGEPVRESGTVVEVNVVYTNLHPFSSTFGDTDVQYHYDIHQTPVSEYKTEFISYGAEQNETTRTIENRHGIFVVVKVSGTFGFFSPVYLLVMLTTACGLLAAATFVTDKLALYVMKDEKYLRAMIDSTEDFHKDSAKHPTGAAGVLASAGRTSPP